MSAKGERVLILIRHAHRDTSDRSADNGLSAKGQSQARALLKHYLKAYPHRDDGPVPRVLSSPKLRCVETVAPIAGRSEARLELDPLLGERRPGEDERAFKERAGQFIARWMAGSDPITVACSHGDWLPVALHSATGAQVLLKKGGWAEIRISEGERPQLRWLIQSFKRLG
jgi:broad specificity phosphatase PhoE